jgi:pimeloyl-ACP methyl ester carboxylesterase
LYRKPGTGRKALSLVGAEVNYKLWASFCSICLLTLQLVCCNPSKPNAQPTGASDKQVSTAGQQTSFYERQGSPDRVIVFVHGIFGSSTATWTCSRDVSWPKLFKDDDAFKGSDIYVAGYDTPYLGNTMTIDEVVANLKNRLDNDEVFTTHREVVFVAHSLGGLIVQRLLLTYRKSAEKVPFIYFYSTPQTGAQIASLGKIFSADPLIKQMLPGNANDYLLNMENEWREAGFGNIRRYCAYEKKSLKGVLVVDRLSATRGCSDGVIPIAEDHLTIVKPCSRNADSYIALRLAAQRNPIAAAKPELRTETVTRRWMSYQPVDCNRTNSQTLTAFVALDPTSNEKIVNATPSLENSDKIQGVTGPTLGPITGNTAQVSYGFNGLDASLSGCPGGGHATVVVTFVIQRQTPVLPAVSAASNSVTVTLPDGLSLKAAVVSIAETDNASARFASTCSQPMLATKVRGGPIAASDRVSLISQLQQRLITPSSTFNLKAIGPSQGGMYEIECTP